MSLAPMAQKVLELLSTIQAIYQDLSDPASFSTTSSSGVGEDAVLIGADFCSNYTANVPFATSAHVQFETDFDPDPDIFTQKDVPG
ncbi:hypothetical protein MMC29_008505 [Sticta canariensis]|nr:hypothetical protein [Sticta canariensis]